VVTATLIDTPGGHPRFLFAALMLGSMSQALTFSAFPSALPQIAHDFGSRGEFVAQMTMGMAALGTVVGAVASGWIVPRWGTRTTMLLSLLTYALCGAAGGIVRDAQLLLASRFGVGFAAACMITTCVWAIAAHYHGDRRARVMGYSYSASAITALTGVVVGGFLAQHGGWRLAFLPYPIFGLVGFALAFASIKQERPQANASSETRWSYLKALWPSYVLAMFVFGVMFMEATQFAFLLEDDGVGSPASRSLIIAAITAVATVTGFFYGRIQQRLKLLGTVTLGLACMAVALAVVAWGIHPVYAVLGAALMGIHDGLVSPYLYHAVAEGTDAFLRSRAVGMMTAFSFLGGFLNPIALAPLKSAVGLRNAFLVVALAMAVVTLGMAVKLVRQRRMPLQRAALL
jgi:MFS transporter, ACDE family, multidrug resistance protein